MLCLFGILLAMFQDVGWRGNKIGDSQFFVRQHYSTSQSRSRFQRNCFLEQSIVECGLDKPASKFDK